MSQREFSEDAQTAGTAAGLVKYFIKAPSKKTQTYDVHKVNSM